MATTHRKRCLTSLVTEVTQIKTTLRYHLTLTKVSIINKTHYNKCWQECGETRTLLHRS